MLRAIFPAALAVLCLGYSWTAAVRADDIATQARQLHFSSLVVDAHVDTTQRLLDDKFDLGARDPRGSVDIPRMREGGVCAIFFAVWMPSKIKGPATVKRALAQLDAIHAQIQKHPQDLALATNAAEICEAHAKGKIALLIGIEGGHIISNDLAVLRRYAKLGARYLTLTHMGNSEWADSSTDKPEHNGLSPFGKQVILEMNRLGMIVDVSHVSDKTLQDVLAVSKAPVFASHSSCRALCDSPRNLSDEMMKGIAAKGGVIQINFHIGFISQVFRDAEKANPDLGKAIEAEATKRAGGSESLQLIMLDEVTREYVKKGMLPQVDWMEIVNHIDHAVRVAGAGHVGLGSDFDGADMPFGMEDASDLPKITEALLHKGYSEGDIRKILGENTLRLMGEVERVSKELGGAKPASKRKKK